jgi:hypothetical protein
MLVRVVTLNGTNVYPLHVKILASIKVGLDNGTSIPR